MVDTILVTRDAGSTIDSVTGNSTANPPTVVYTGPGYVRVPDSYELDIIHGDVQRTKQRFICTIPDLAAGEMPQHDDLLTMQTGPDALVGVPFRVVEVTGGSMNIGYRVSLERVS